MKTFTQRTVAKRGRVVQPISARFHAALKLAGLNVSSWAKQNKYSAGFVYGVLDGSRVSAPCISDMQRFVAKHLPQEAA